MTERQLEANYRAEGAPEGTIYTFYCGLTGEPVHRSGPYAEESAETLGAARREARGHFNRCRQCGRWVSDAAYNIDEMKCVACAPNRGTPHYCTVCGQPLRSGSHFCTRCGRSVAAGSGA